MLKMMINTEKMGKAELIDRVRENRAREVLEPSSGSRGRVS